MKIVFMGTPDYAVGALQALIDAGHEVTAVVTQPDKPKGRGKEMQFPPVKECALLAGIPVLQPRKIREREAIEELAKYEADVFVVAAFGQILSKEILEMPRFGSLNIHASLLPKYRGAAPIQWALINGESETGITIMQMDEGIDTGDMLAKSVVPITDEDTGDSLFDKLTKAGAKLIVETLPLLEQGKLIPKKQDESLSTHTKKIGKSLGHIDWSKDATSLARLVRGLNSWPSAYTYRNGKQLKIWEAVATDETARGKECGTIFAVNKDSFLVQTGKGSLQILSVQLEGKKRMAVKDFLLGYQMQPGEKLGN